MEWWLIWQGLQITESQTKTMLLLYMMIQGAALNLMHYFRSKFLMTSSFGLVCRELLGLFFRWNQVWTLNPETVNNKHFSCPSSPTHLICPEYSNIISLVQVVGQLLWFQGWEHSPAWNVLDSRAVCFLQARLQIACNVPLLCLNHLCGTKELTGRVGWHSVMLT